MAKKSEEIHATNILTLILYKTKKVHVINAFICGPDTTKYIYITHWNNELKQVNIESSNLQSLVRHTNKQATKLQQRILLDPKLERRMANSNHRFGVKFKSC